MSGIPYQRGNTDRENFIDISGLTPLPTSHLFNHYSIKHDVRCIEHIKSNGIKPDYWHRFTIVKDSNCEKTYSKLYLLKLITDFVYPYELLPLYVSEKTNKLLFLARNCLDAIIRLCEVQLILPNPLEPHFPFSIIIIENISTIRQIPVVNIEPNLVQVLKIRESRGTIDLTSFHEDKNLHEFCPLYQPKVLLYVLSLTSNLEKNDLKVTKIVLCNNDIRRLPTFESFRDRNFTAIDLGNNKLQSIEDVVPLKDFPRLQWVRLDGNPLCCRFDSGLTYFLYVKTICKNLQTLDTKRLCEDGWYKKHRTFLCSSKGFDFANQFVQQYYTHFDEHRRQHIGYFYHQDAMFSFTHRSAKALPFGHEHLNCLYFQERNLFIRKTKHFDFLRIGRGAIEHQFQQSFPPVRHHRHSFYVDLMQYTKTLAIICVTGVFKDFPSHFLKEEILFGFTRTFVLTSKDSKEWLITNDIWHMYRPYQLKGSLPPWPEPKLSSFPEPQYRHHREALTSTLESVTGMTHEHSKKFLMKNEWNLELALKVFIDEHINNQIPDEAFNNEKNDVKDTEEIESDDDVIITEDDILPSITTLLISKPPTFVTPSLGSSGKQAGAEKTTHTPQELEDTVEDVDTEIRDASEESTTTIIVPITRHPHRETPPEVKDLIRENRRLRRVYSKTRTEDNKRTLNQHSQILRDTLRNLAH